MADSGFVEKNSGAPEREPYRPRVVADLIRMMAADRPDHPAILFEGRAITAAELDRASNRVANALAGAGLEPGDRVAYLGRNMPEAWELFFGCVKAGVVLAPLNWRLAGGEVAAILEDLAPQLLVLEEMFRGPLDDAANETVRTVRRVMLESAGEGAFAAFRDAGAATDVRYVPHKEDIVLQMYTSGTTGLPKGVMLSNRPMTAFIGDKLETASRVWREDEVVLCNLPMFHITGLGWAYLGMRHGAPVVLHRQFDPALFFEDVAKHKVTRTVAVPAMILFLLLTPGADKADMSSMRYVLYGASPMPLDILEKGMAFFKGAGWGQGYGMTEVCGAATYLSPEDHARGGKLLQSAGRPYPDFEVKVRDDAGRTCAPGGIGEVFIKAPTIMNGYWRRDDATAEVLDNGWYRSGDAGYFDEEGYLFIVDRLKDMVISGGENVYPAEVESAMSTHPAIADVAVIGVPDPKWGEAVVAVVVKAPGSDPQPEELIAHARSSLAGFKVPRRIEFAEMLPRNPTGKILKRELRNMYTA